MNITFLHFVSISFYSDTKEKNPVKQKINWEKGVFSELFETARKRFLEDSFGKHYTYTDMCLSSSLLW